MSQENVEIVRRGNAAFNDGEVDAFLEVIAPDAELQDLANPPDRSGVVNGRAAIHEAWTFGQQPSMNSAPMSMNTSTRVTL